MSTTETRVEATEPAPASPRKSTLRFAAECAGVLAAGGLIAFGAFHFSSWATGSSLPARESQSEASAQEMLAYKESRSTYIDLVKEQYGVTIVGGYIDPALGATSFLKVERNEEQIECQVQRIGGVTFSVTCGSPAGPVVLEPIS